MKTKKLQPVVCILNPDDAYYLKERENSNNVECYITPHEALELQKENVVFPAIRENVVYMLNPLEKNEYIYRTENTDENAIAVRINKIEEILSLLGGKNFKLISKSSAKIHDGRDVTVDADVSVGQKEEPNVKVSSKTSVNTQNNSQKDTTIADGAKWSGKYTKKGYQQALQIAQQYGLDQDPEINSILIQRHPKHPNHIKSKNYSIHTHSDLEKNLQVAEKLQCDVKQKVGIDIDVNVKTSHAQSETSTFDFTVEFGPVRKNWLWCVLGGVSVAIIGILMLIFGGIA